MVAEKGTVSARTNDISSTQWDVWFGGNSRVFRENRAFDATPDSVMNDDFAYVLPLGFSLLPADAALPAHEEVVKHTAAHDGALAADSSEGRTLVSVVRIHTSASVLFILVLVPFCDIFNTPCISR